MPRQIIVSDETFTRLKILAEPFVDREPEDVIRRLLDQNEHALGDGMASLKSDGQIVAPASRHEDRSPASRVPRERGAIVQIGGREIKAVSVRDLYEQALKFLVETFSSKLETVLPLNTSRERYLIAKKDVHPTGNSFVVPVEFHGFYMEAHKDYKNAVGHLGILCKALGLSFKYLG